MLTDCSMRVTALLEYLDLALIDFCATTHWITKGLFKVD